MSENGPRFMSYHTKGRYISFGWLFWLLLAFCRTPHCCKQIPKYFPQFATGHSPFASSPTSSSPTCTSQTHGTSLSRFFGSRCLWQAASIGEHRQSHYTNTEATLPSSNRIFQRQLLLPKLSPSLQRTH